MSRTYGIPLLDADSTGTPLLYVGRKSPDDPFGRPTRFTWRDSMWSDPIACLPYCAGPPAPSLSLGKPSFLAWLSAQDDSLYNVRMIAANLDSTCAPPETVMTTTSQDTDYGAAASARRRWVVRSQQRVPSQAFGVRVAYSDTVGIWHEVHDVGEDASETDIAPLDDSTAIVAYAGGEPGLGYAILRGSQWVEEGVLESRAWWSDRPRFRFRPSGGLWLAWPDRVGRMHVSRYVDGRWYRGDSIIVPRPPGETYIGAWCAVSRDTAERPVLAWGQLGYAYTYRDVIVVSVPNDSSWDYGEEVPGSEWAQIPAVTRDRNGDVWVAWRSLRQGITGMTHTYTAVTAESLEVLGAGRDRMVRWWLTGHAPHSWWTVLRARGDRQFEPVARVEVGRDTLMSWTDRSAPAGILRYKVRRDCLDKRYEWTSGEARWPPKSRRPLMLGPIPSPSTDSIVLDLADAAEGPVAVRIHDIQGRLVHTYWVAASASGHETIRLDLRAQTATVRSGVYFVRAEDSTGSFSTVAKVVVLR